MSATDDSPPPAVVSVHDVGPATLDAVGRLLERIRPVVGHRVALLVVPGLPWTPGDVDRLKRWQADGLELAGHGWVHHGPPRSPYHRLHGWVLSRDQAEHLSRSGSEIEALMSAGVEWFRTRGLGTPELYVPPAWALGRISREALRRLPYRWIEVLRGFVDVESHTTHRCPLIGFEADTRFRHTALTLFNAASIAWARARRLPLRIGFHPEDLDLRLADAALASVRRRWRFLDTAEAMEELGKG